MGSASIAALLIGLGVGPPVLPPFPGERPAEPPPEAAQKSEPSKPSKPPPRVDAKSQTETKTPASKPAPAEAPPPSAPPPEGTFSIPESVAPPQPNVAGPPVAAEQPTAEAPEEKPSPSSSAPEAGPRIGDPLDESARPAYLQLPPPTRPPYRGTGLFIAAGATFSIALTEQIIAHRLVKTRCIDPIGRGDFDTGEDLGDAVQGCAPGVLPAFALRVHSDIGLLATIGLATAGAMTRANSDAYSHVFDNPQRRTVAGLRIAGISLIGAGVVSWLSTGAASWGVVGNCKTARCVNGGRLMGFITRDVSVAMVASGAGMLAFAETYRRRHDGYTRDRALSVGPQVSWGQVGLRAHGRF